MILYDMDTGEIVGTLHCSENLVSSNIALLPNGVGCFQFDADVTGETYYYDLANSLVPRPEITAALNKASMFADGLDSIIISGLPVPCELEIEEVTYDVPDGDFEFTTTLAGTYTIIARSFPYLEKSWEVTAT